MTSWVLILSPRRIADRPAHPAVVGGYRTKDEAEAAGRIATMAEARERDDYGALYWCEWEAFTVIPGAADTPPESAP